MLVVSTVWHAAIASTQTTSDEWDRDPWLANAPGGVITQALARSERMTGPTG